MTVSEKSNTPQHPTPGRQDERRARLQTICCLHGLCLSVLHLMSAVSGSSHTTPPTEPPRRTEETPKRIDEQSFVGQSSVALHMHFPVSSPETLPVLGQQAPKGGRSISFLTQQRGFRTSFRNGLCDSLSGKQNHNRRETIPFFFL